MHDPEILIRPDAVRAALDEYTEIAAGLEQMARQLNEAMAEGRAGDREGFIAEGLASGDAAAQSFYMAAAMLRDLIADTHATMDAVERVDSAFALPNAATPIGAALDTAPADAAAQLLSAANRLTSTRPTHTTTTLVPADTDTAALIQEISQALQQRDIAHRSVFDGMPILGEANNLYGYTYYGYGNQSNYTIDDLNLHRMTRADLERLSEYVSTPGARVCRVASISVEDALRHTATLQRYWGYTNQQMVTALRELYYPSALDNFILGAAEVDSSILALNAPNKTDVEHSEAALALALLHLSRQRQGYVEPVLPITRDGAEIGFDHVVAGLDGFFNPAIQPQGWLADNALNWLRVSEIDSVAAVTWQGDVAATVQQTYNALSDRSPELWNFQRFPNVPACEVADAFEAGYCVEMPPEDFEGDVMANVLIDQRDQLGLTADGKNLSIVLAAAYDPAGPLYPNRYRRFAELLELKPDPRTGALEPNARRQFIQENIAPVSGFAAGLIILERGDPGVGIVVPAITPVYAKEQLERFLNQLEAKLQPPTLTREKP